MRWNPAVSFLTFIGECTILLFESIRRSFSQKLEVRETISQMAFVGAASVPIVALTTFFSGSVLALYSTQILLRFGASGLAGATIGLAVAREIGPVLAGIMVAARCGSAMAAQIGTMAVTEQIDALKVLGVNPTQYLLVPRLTASVLMLPVLALLGMYAGILGGFLVSVASGLSSGSFMSSLQQYVLAADFLFGMLKTLFFGAIIAIVACQQGLRTKNGAVGVGNATTNTVVISMVLIYIANYYLSSILYQ